MSGVDLAGFLLARITEDEAAARAMLAPGEMHPWGDTRKPEGQSEDVPAWVRGYLGGTWGEHFARHDPARVLAECEAKRRIVERYGYLHEHGDTGDMRWVLPLLALPYADHPDYRQEWAP